MKNENGCRKRTIYLCCTIESSGRDCYLYLAYLCSELDKDHVLVWSGVSDNPCVLNGRVTGCSELEKIMDGHGGGDSQETQHL